MVDKPVSYSEEAEVVVVGYGGAGAVAAVSAYDAGASVLIVEKQSADTPVKTNHTPSTRMCAGGWFSPEDPEKTALYLRGLVHAASEVLDDERQKMINVFAKYLTTNTAWLKSIGANVEPSDFMSDFPDLPGSDCCTLARCKTQGAFRNGASLFRDLTQAVEKRDIRIMWESPATHLITEGGEVRGVVVKNKGKEISIKASRAVILTCGGFEFSEWMKQNYLRVYPAHFYGNPASTGDGINMVMEVGAALWHMNAASWRVNYKFPEFPIAFGTHLHEHSTIIVDKRGQRFANERFKLHSFGYELTNYDSYARCYPRVPCYIVFDEKRRKMAPMVNYYGASNPPGGIMGDINYIWDEDNKKEIDRGWIMKDSSIEGLARQIGALPENNGLMTPSELSNTVRRFNKLCHEGKDLDFDKPKEFMNPLEDPPYYAMVLWPGGPNTQGGPKRNEKGQVLRVDNTPLPRLYAAGELGSVWGMLYQVGGNLGECFAFGRITGTNAAAEKIWK
jgi:succinate dehydrogenase/fumarate reductase flavoprotein subunit